MLRLRKRQRRTYHPGTVPADAQCGLVLGGDGTLIRAVRDLGTNSLPLLGINLGTLGYLTDVELKILRQLWTGSLTENRILKNE